MKNFKLVVNILIMTFLISNSSTATNHFENLDATCRVGDRVYCFKGDQYFRYNLEEERIDQSWQKYGTDQWKGIPANIDAVIYNERRDVFYFFKGSHYYRYEWVEGVVGGKSLINGSGWHNFNWSDIDAAIQWNNTTTYFFKGDQYVRYEWGEGPTYKSINQDWREIAAFVKNDKINAGFRTEDGIACFFSKNDYSRYYKRLLDKLPNSVKNNTLNCPSAKNWMKSIKDDTPLGKITIPGTHDTGTFDCSLSSTQCQDKTYKQQLNGGIRYFDIRCRGRWAGQAKYTRIGNHPEEFDIVHGGCVTDYSFTEVLRACRDFLDANPSETIIMRLGDDASIVGSKLDPANTLKYFEEVFNKVRKKSEFRNLNWYGINGKNYNLFHTPIKDIRGRIVLIDDSPSAGKINGNFPWNNSNGMEKPNVDNSYDVDKNAEYAIAKAEASNVRNKNNNHKSLYMVDPAQNSLSDGITNWDHSPKDYAKKANPKLADYLSSNPIGSYGVFGLDYPFEDFSNDLVFKLILSNQNYFKQ